METQKRYKWDIVWVNVILLGLLHLISVYALFIKFSGKWQSQVFYKMIIVLTNLSVTSGAHRLWSHRTYKANNICQIILATVMSFTYQNSIYIWCRDHRLHHKYTETDADPHNAKRGFFFSHVGWLLVKKHNDIIEKGKTIDISDLKANPIVMFQHKYYFYILSVTMLFLPIFVPWYFWGENLTYSICVCCVYKYIAGVNTTWSVNSFAHLHGDKPYDKNSGAVENVLAKYVSFGEGFHNFHHAFPYDYKTNEFANDRRNFTTTLIDFFAFLGWATDRKTVPREIIDKRIKRTGDGTKTSKLSFLTNLKHCFFIFLFLFLL